MMYDFLMISGLFKKRSMPNATHIYSSSYSRIVFVVSSESQKHNMFFANNHKNTVSKQFTGKQPVPKTRSKLRRERTESPV